MKHLTKPRKRMNKFVKFLLIYSGVLFAIIIGVWLLLYFFIGDYEEGLPTTAMNDITSTFTAEQVDTFLDSVTIETGAFCETTATREYLKEKLTKGTITYSKKNGEYSDDSPVYILYSEKKPIAKLSLVSKEKNSFKFNIWKADTITINGDVKNQDLQTVTITAPSESTITINGVTVGSEYAKENNITFDPCNNVSDYVTTPTLTTYEVPEILGEPAINVSLNGITLALTGDGNSYSCGYPTDTTMLSELENTITEHAESYGKYLINRGSLASIKSFMIGTAQSYVNDVPAIWAFLAHIKTGYTYEFKNQSITNLVKYSDDCFSCEVYFDLYVEWATGNKTYDTSMTYTYVKVDGKWCIADFVIN